MPTRPLARRLAALGAVSVLMFAVVACDETAVEDLPSASPSVARVDAATPPPASQVALENMLGGWRSRPVPIIASTQEVVVDACRSAPVAGFGGGDGPGDLPVAVVDTRGLGRVTVIFADDERWSACLATVDADGQVVVTAAGQLGDPSVEPVGDDEIAISTIEVLDDLDASQRSLLIGRVGKHALGTVSGFDDETYVDGAYANGWYTMWWPGNVEAASVSAIDRGRVTIGSVNPRN